MPSLGTLCSLLLFSVLWMDLAMAGSSFLSPEHQKVQFNAPFDVGIKLSGAQYQEHGQALGKFLQDILWEEANGKSLSQSGHFGFLGVPNVSPADG
uniref:Appetite-regulating hormone n=2 Tax=Ursus TaxID=9639 RepID=A0A452UWM1_URSMA